MKAPLLLVIDDDEPIRRYLRVALTGAGYELIEAADGQSGLALASARQPDLVLLDLGLPDLEGQAVLAQLRAASRVPVIVLSARDQEWAKVAALDAGADDYLTKPFATGELLARLRVALRHAARRSAPDAPEPVRLAVGGLEVDVPSRQVRLDGQPVHLTPIEYRLLVLLLAHAGRVLTHAFLLDALWGQGALEEPHHVRVHMANLRRKLEADPSQPRYLLTEQGVGYRMAES